MILTETPQEHKTSIRYNRSALQWEAVNGKVTPTGSGPDGKRAALLLALAHDHPHLAAIAADIIRLHGQTNDITSRIIKAAQLIVKGHVFAGMVRSQTQPDTYYKVGFTGTPKSYTCDCPDNRVTDDHLGEICKHTLAQHLAYIAGIALDAAPIPFRGEAVIVHGAPDLTDAAGLPF